MKKKNCDSPLYYKGDSFLGKNPLASTEDFGLVVYEPLFARPNGRWYEGKKPSDPELSRPTYEQAEEHVGFVCWIINGSRHVLLLLTWLNRC